MLPRGLPWGWAGRLDTWPGSARGCPTVVSSGDMVAAARRRAGSWDRSPGPGSDVENLWAGLVLLVAGIQPRGQGCGARASPHSPARALARPLPEGGPLCKAAPHPAGRESPRDAGALGAPAKSMEKERSPGKSFSSGTSIQPRAFTSLPRRRRKMSERWASPLPSPSFPTGFAFQTR